MGIISNKELIGWILEDVTQNNQTRDEIIKGLQKLYNDLSTEIHSSDEVTG